MAPDMASRFSSITDFVFALAQPSIKNEEIHIVAIIAARAKFFIYGVSPVLT